MFRALKWLLPGMRVKRWIAVIFLGVFLSNLGAAALILGLLSREAAAASWTYGLAALFFLLGGVALLVGVYRLMKSLGELLELRGRRKELVDIAFERRYLGLGPRVVALGGGTGMSILLEGLKEYTAQIVAVVSVADDGGSSGRLRREFDMLPPGDIRKCLVALSDESPLLGELMRYRFSDTELAGHSFGNLFLTVLWQLTGDFAEAVRQAGRILSVRGQVVPATLDRVSLVATHEDGSRTVGQREISESRKRIRRVEMRPNPGPASRDVLDAIAQADIIVIGPGSLYTSILPNFLIAGIPEAIRRSGAAKVYVANIASHEGETAGFSLKDHLEAIGEHTGPLPFGLVLVNSSTVPPLAIKELREAGGSLVRYDSREFQNDGYSVRFVEADLGSHESVLRHDPRKLARSLLALLAEERDNT